MKRWIFLHLLLIATMPLAQAASKLQIEGAWIRNMPPGAMMLAGYAILHNVSDTVLVVTGASSEIFGDVSMHQTIIDKGIARMRPLERLEIPSGGNVALAPGGKHLMLMQPKHQFVLGDKVEVILQLADGSSVSANFEIREQAPGEVSTADPQ